MENENWRQVPGYEVFYEVSDCGRVRSLGRVVEFAWHYPGHKPTTKKITKHPRFLKPDQDRDGYFRVTLVDSDGNARHWGIHVLVAQAFIPNPDKLQEVAHLDHKRQNNVPGNLKWASRAGNHSDSVIENRYALAGPNLGTKRVFTADDIRAIRARYAAGERQMTIASSLGVRQEQIRKIVMRERWAHIE